MAYHDLPKRLYIREFLNKPEFYAGAYVLVSVEDSSGEDDRHWSDISCTIADCNEQISLQFALHDPADRENSLHKADLLAKAFTEFAAALRAEAGVIAERQAREAEAANQSG